MDLSKVIVRISILLDPYGSTGTPVEEELLRSRNSPHTIYIGASRSMVHVLALWLFFVRGQYSGGIGVAQVDTSQESVQFYRHTAIPGKRLTDISLPRTLSHCYPCSHGK